jgi:hypothetical protein
VVSESLRKPFNSFIKFPRYYIIIIISIFFFFYFFFFREFREKILKKIKGKKKTVQSIHTQEFYPFFLHNTDSPPIKFIYFFL